MTFPKGQREDCYYWDPNEWINFILQSQYFFQFVQRPEGVWNVFVRGDGYTVGDDSAVLFVAMLINFGELSKAVSFNWPLFIGQLSEKDVDDLYIAMTPVRQRLDQWIETGMAIPQEGIYIPVHVDFGGDNAWGNMFTGTKVAGGDLGCFSCYWFRHTDYKESQRIERSIDLYPTLAAIGAGDHVRAPFVNMKHLSQFHPCGLHAIIAFGKDILQFSCAKNHNRIY